MSVCTNEMLDNQPQPLLLDLKAAATVIGVSVWTLRDWCHKRQVPYVIAGKRWMIPRASLEKAIERMAITSVRQTEKRGKFRA